MPRDARSEILDGFDSSTVVNVNRANSIENRLNKLLVHLAATDPAGNWEKFIDGSGSEPQPKWSETMIAGSSLGAGQAAMIAAEHSDVPRGPDARLGGRQARLGHARRDALEQVLHADPPARELLRDARATPTSRSS